MFPQKHVNQIRAHIVIDESSESSVDSIADDKEVDLVSQHDKYNYSMDPEGTTPELDSPSSPNLFESDEVIDMRVSSRSCGSISLWHEFMTRDVRAETENKQRNNMISVGVNTDPFLNSGLMNDLDIDTIEKCYTLGIIIGRAMTKMSKERRENFIHQLSQCLELHEMKK